MTFRIPNFAYPPAGDGYWSPVTSTLNWCEEDYYATIYSAEIVNTLTNLWFIFLAIKGIRNCLRNDHDRIFVVTFIGYLIVGSGSFLFHTTLKYPMQLVDELSMIYTTCLMFYATFSYNKSKLYARSLAVFLICLAAFITGYYHYLQDPTFHQNAYAILTAIVLLRAMYNMEMALRPSFRQDSTTISGLQTREQARRDTRDLVILKRMWTMVAFGLTVFLSGFALWNVDNRYCSTLRQTRREIGLPWGVILEGHGWWHLMTGLGAYFYITWGIWLRHCLNGKQDKYELYWPSILFSVPLINQKDYAQIKQLQNGSATKRL